MTEKEFLKDVQPLTEVDAGRALAIFPCLPLSPSSNSQYFLARRGSKTYHIPSEELKTFKRLMAQYPKERQASFTLNRARVLEWVKKGYRLECRVVFFFHLKRVMTLKNTPKKMDTSNRLKALHDQLCDLLGIDDSLFFKIYAEKAICSDSMNEQAYCEILPIE